MARVYEMTISSNSYHDTTSDVCIRNKVSGVVLTKFPEIEMCREPIFYLRREDYTVMNHGKHTNDCRRYVNLYITACQRKPWKPLDNRKSEEKVCIGMVSIDCHVCESGGK